jgi:tRNA threonylcarbamoyladenosine biosynthesis protein TsaB
MKVLGLDTATLTAGIALVDGDRIVAQARHDTSGRSADLLVAIDAVCRTAGIAPSELDAVAVGAGPGSFTGLRIGMATAKGIAFAAQRPLWAVSSLAALAHDATVELANRQLVPVLDGVIVAALDARRGEVYAGCYRADGTAVGVERVLAPAELAPWVAELAGDALQSFAGDALASFPDVLAPLASRWLPIATPSGASVAQVALAGARVDVVTGGAPMYIRPSEAEVMYPDGVPGAIRKKP